MQPADDHGVLTLPVPLGKLERGRAGHITHIDHHDRSTERKLLALGLLPGVRVELQQRSPAFVIRVGRTQLAIDSALADAIRVRPL